MKKLFLLTLILSILLAGVFGQPAGKKPARNVFSKSKLSSFPLLLPAGKKTYLPTSLKKLLVFAFLSPECPLSKNYSLKLSEIKKKYEGQVSFIGIIPGTFEASEVIDFQTSYLSSWLILRDNTLKLTRYLQGKVTPEVVVIDNKSGLLIYRGAIDDWAVSPGKTRNSFASLYLDNTLTDFLNNKKILISYRKPVGCFINDF